MTHWSEYFLFCQESQRHLFHSRIHVSEYWTSQWLHKASDEHILTSWYVMKKCAAKIEDEEQEDIEWTHSQNHS